MSPSKKRARRKSPQTRKSARTRKVRAAAKAGSVSRAESKRAVAAVVARKAPKSSGGPSEPRGVSRETFAKVPRGVVAKLPSPDLVPLLVPIGELNEDPANANTHDEASIEGIRASLDVYGQHRIAVVQRGSNVVRVGNGMLLAARRLEWTHLAAIRVDEADVRATGRALADNRASELGKRDRSAVLAQIEAIQAEQGHLEGLAWSDEQLEELRAEQARQTARHQAAADPARLAAGFGDEERAAIEVLAGYRTSMARSGQSAPMKAYQRRGLLVGDVLDYGAGQDTHGLARFDPAYDPDYSLLTRRWHVVVCNYVLNVLPLEHQRVEALLAMRGLLDDDGYLLLAVWRKSGTDTQSPKGYQCSWGLEEWEALFGHWFHAERLGARGFMGWKLKPRAT